MKAENTFIIDKSSIQKYSLLKYLSILVPLIPLSIIYVSDEDASIYTLGLISILLAYRFFAHSWKSYCLEKLAYSPNQVLKIVYRDYLTKRKSIQLNQAEIEKVLIRREKYLLAKDDYFLTIRSTNLKYHHFYLSSSQSEIETWLTEQNLPV